MVDCGVWLAVGWWRTNCEGGVPADFGVIRTVLVGEMEGAKLAAFIVGMGM